jgi:hypothetical protein
MAGNNSLVNPAFMSAYYNLKSACADYNVAVAKYGKNSKESQIALSRRTMAGSLFSNTKGIIKADNNGVSKSDALFKIDACMNDVRTWFDKV